VPRASLLAILVSLLGSTLAAAQRCRGFSPFQRRPVQVSISALLGQDSRSYDAGVTLGGSSVFGGLKVGAIDIDAFNAASSTLGGFVGFQNPPDKRGRVAWCLVADAEFARGPKDINGTGIDYSETDVSFGAEAGVVTTSTAQLEIVPTGSIALVNAATKLGASGTASNTTVFGIVGLGIGFLLGQQVSITPSVSRAIGVSGASTTLRVTISFRLGGAPVVPTPPTSCAGLASADSTVYDTTQVTERPRLRTASEPWYPPLERQSGREGQVIVDVIIGRDGTPEGSSMRIAQRADSAFDREALRWIRSVSYWPACRGGLPVRTRIAQPVDFCVFGCRRGKS
jgi:TonB family protein